MKKGMGSAKGTTSWDSNLGRPKRNHTYMLEHLSTRLSARTLLNSYKCNQTLLSFAPLLDYFDIFMRDDVLPQRLQSQFNLLAASFF